MKFPTRSQASYISVRCRRVDSSLGTAVKWFPSRYLKERCRVTCGKEALHTLCFLRDTVPDFPGWPESLVYSLRASPPFKAHPTYYIQHLTFICDYFSAGWLRPTMAGLQSKTAQC